LRTKTVRTHTHTDRQTDRHTPLTTRPDGLRRAGKHLSNTNVIQISLSKCCLSAGSTSTNNQKYRHTWTCRRHWYHAIMHTELVPFWLPAEKKTEVLSICVKISLHCT